MVRFITVDTNNRKRFIVYETYMFMRCMQRTLWTTLNNNIEISVIRDLKLFGSNCKEIVAWWFAETIAIDS